MSHRRTPGLSPQYARDITIPANGQAEFSAPYSHDFFFVNQNTVAVTVQKGGKAPLTLAAQAYLRDWIDQGDNVVIIGTVGLVISVYDTYDVRPIPTAKDILGAVNLAGPSTVGGGDSNLGLIETTGQQKVSLYDSAGNAFASATAAPAANARAQVVRNIPSGTQGVNGTVTANQGLVNATPWNVIGKDAAGIAAIGGILLVGGYDINGLVNGIPIDTSNPSAPVVPIGIPTSASIAVFGNLNPAFPVLVTKAIDAILLNRKSFAVHLTTNVTTTITAATAYISSVVITTDAAGTTSTITIQNKEATPKKLVNAAVTTAISTTPTVLALDEPVLMTSGIDIITAGVAAATVDVWVTYYQ